jgi:3-oxoacyl-[acyl-carrier-protein] synthase-1
MFATHPFIVDRYGDPIRVSRAPWVPAEMGLCERMSVLTIEAASEAIQPALAVLTAKRRRIGVVLGFPAVRPGWPSDTADELLTRIAGLLPRNLIQEECRTLLLGHVGGMAAIEQGWQLIREEVVDVCLVGGVESYIERRTLEWIDWSWQLQARTFPWGFIPGEAAGFCLLASEQCAAAAGIPVLATVLGAATALEPRLRRDHTICIGEGLTESMRRTLAVATDGIKVDQTICDLNGQTHRADEFGFAMMRLCEKFRDPSRFRAPADSWGDVGAASGPLFVALAAMAGQKRYAAGPYTLLCTAAMLAERSSILLHVSVAA